MFRWRAIPQLTAGLALALPGRASAQGRDTPPDVAAYFRAVGEHFRVPTTEVEVLSAWGLPADQVPVVLFLARRGGVSSDALVSWRRRGHAWSEVAEHVGLDATVFHVPLPDGAPLGPLTQAYQRFAATPRQEWSAIALSDDEVAALVNIRFLGAELGVPPARVLEVAARTGSFVSAYRVLRRS